MASDYSKISFLEIDELNVFEFWALVHDGYIYNLMQTQEGQKYLEDCWRLNQKNPERSKLKRKFGKGATKM